MLGDTDQRRSSPLAYAAWSALWSGASVFFFLLAYQQVLNLRTEYSERILHAHVVQESNLRLRLAERSQSLDSGANRFFIHLQINPSYGKTLFRRVDAPELEGWQRAAQAELARGRPMVTDTVMVAGDEWVRVAHPLPMEPSCHACHRDAAVMDGDLFGVAYLEARTTQVLPPKGTVFGALLLGMGSFWMVGLLGGGGLVWLLLAAHRARDAARARLDEVLAGQGVPREPQEARWVWSLGAGVVLGTGALNELLDGGSRLFQSTGEDFLARLCSHARGTLRLAARGERDHGLAYGKVRSEGRGWVYARCTWEAVRGEDGAVLRLEGELTPLDDQQIVMMHAELGLRGGGLGVWSWDPVALEVYASDRVVDILGLSREALADPLTALQGVLHPEDVHRLSRLYRALFTDQGASFYIDHRVKTKTGTWRWVGSRASVVQRDEEGRPTRIAGVLEELHSSLLYAMQGLVRLHDHGPVVALRWAAAEGWPVAYASINVLDLLGVESADLVSGRCRYADLVHPEDVERVAREVQTYTAEGRVDFTQDYRVVRPDGAVRWIHDYTRVNRDVDGRPQTYDGFVYDITDQIEAQQALQESQAFLGQLVEAIPATVMVIDPSSYRVVFANRGLRDGRAPEALTCHALGHGSDAPCALEHPCPLHQVVRDRIPVTSVHQHLAPDGRMVPMEVTLSPVFGREGEVRWVVETSVDLEKQLRQQDERLALERRVHQAQKSESLTVLAGGVAHDFNNLLVGMLGNADILAESLAPGEEPRVLAEEIRHAATRAAELTRQLLAYVGQGKLQSQLIDLAAVTREMVDLARSSITRAARLELDLQPVWVEGDITQLRQVVLNLVTNAAEALPKGGGTVWVRTYTVDAHHPILALDPIQPRLEPWTGPVAVLEVRDQGEGMQPQVMASILDPFYTTKATGRGLGLAAVAGIVQSHTGAMLLTSEVGVGTAFSVLLPSSLPGADEDMAPV
ncbi:MAG: PAS domain-containing protein, partial [Deltaproteobacteria bacterium]|nr:PAS domain-containing protein [Deltaproteobacteria bacterium]